MTLYEIQKDIEAAINGSLVVDEETGEIVSDFSAVEELIADRDEKLTSLICVYKNKAAEAAAIKAEIEALKKRAEKASKEAEHILNYCDYCLKGEGFASPKGEIKYRKSEVVECFDEDVPKKFLVKKVSFAPDKKAIKEAIKKGVKVKGCALVEKQNISIK